MAAWVQGATHPVWPFIWRTDSGALKDFTGVTSFTLILRPVPPSTGPDINGGGSFVWAAAGIVQYTPVATDVATPGVYNLFVTANYGAIPDTADPYPFTIVAK